MPSDTPLLQFLSIPELLLCLMFDGLVTARPTTMSVEQKTNINFHVKFGIASTETLDLLKAVMSRNTIGANHVTFKSVRLAQKVQEAEERVHVEVEDEGSSLKIQEDDVVRLFRPQGHRSQRNCFVGYHREPAVLQGMSTSTSSTNFGTSHLPSQTHQAGSVRDQELNAGSRPTRWRMLPSVSGSSLPISRSQCLSTLRTKQPSLPVTFGFSKP